MAAQRTIHSSSHGSPWIDRRGFLDHDLAGDLRLANTVDCERTLATISRALPCEVLNAAWQEGRLLSDEEGLALALKSLD
jgi:hypothetical protein